MRWKTLLSFAYALLVCYGNASSSSEDVLFQVSTLEALEEGVFEGTTIVGALLEH